MGILVRQTHKGLKRYRKAIFQFSSSPLTHVNKPCHTRRKRNGEKDKVGVKREINAATESDVNWEAAWRISRLNLNGDAKAATAQQRDQS